MRRLSILLLCLPTIVQAQVPAPTQTRPAKLGQCVACHGEKGHSRIAGTPHLSGQDQVYLVAAITAYRTGTRHAQPMNSIANTLQPRDIAALARWYSRQPTGLSR